MHNFSTAEAPDVPIKEIVKQLINPKICKRLGKEFEINQSGMMINVFFEHEDEDKELQTLYNVNPILFKERSMAPRYFYLNSEIIKMFSYIFFLGNSIVSL